MWGPDATGNPGELLEATAAKASCPPGPEVLSHKVATSIVCTELTPLLRGWGGREGLGLAYNRESLAITLSGKTEIAMALSLGAVLWLLGP